MPTFGSVLRGYRLGYHWSDKHGCFIRLSGTREPFRIDLAPDGGVPAKALKEDYRCWWDKPEVLDMCEPLKMIRGVKKPITFYVSESGDAI